MEYRKLGRTDIEVSAICLGCWALIGGSTWGEQDRRQSAATIHAAMDAGINFYDTAPAYGGGESEQLVGRALAEVRKDVIIATKISGDQLAPDALAESCEASLRLLRTDVIDLLQIHWPSRQVPMADTLGAMRRLQEAGKVRAIGVSNFGPGVLAEAAGLASVETNQLCYSMLWRAVEWEIQPLCVERGIGILCYSPLCQGLLTGKFTSADQVPTGRARTRLFSKDRPESRHQEAGCEAEAFRAIKQIRGIAQSVRQPMGQVALAWLLAQPGVTAAVAGARSPEQVRQNAQAADLKLAKDVLEELSAVTGEVKDRIGPNADMWQSDSRMEG
jgi:myo-inositol catabolism protein IolS